MGLGKDKSAFNYKYVTGDKVLGTIKPLMNDLGLLLKQEVLSIENERQDYSAKDGIKSEILSKLSMRFTWVDTETGEKDENYFGANGQNGWDKGVGSAITYAERYFLLKYFHIATDEDDIDNPDKKSLAVVAPAPKPEPSSAPAPAPALQPNTSFDDTDRKEKALTALKKAKKVSTVKGLMSEQKAFRATPEGADFQSGVTIDDVVKLNSIELVGAFYKFVK